MVIGGQAVGKGALRVIALAVIAVGAVAGCGPASLSGTGSRVGHALDQGH